MNSRVEGCANHDHRLRLLDFPHLLVCRLSEYSSQWRGEYTIYLVKMELIISPGFVCLEFDTLLITTVSWWYHTQEQIRVYAVMLI